MVRPVHAALELELPSGEHRERLLAALGNLIRRRGFETFVVAPVLLPRSEYFPERWERSVLGARRLLRRLMHYAGLGEFPLSLESWRSRATTQHVVHASGDETAAWFAGFNDGVCEFGLAIEGLRDEESLIATLGHEVAHAYRNHHGLVIRDGDPDHGQRARRAAGELPALCRHSRSALCRVVRANLFRSFARLGLSTRSPRLTTRLA